MVTDPISGIELSNTSEIKNMETSIIDFVSNNMILAVVWIGIVVALIQNVVKQKTAGYQEVDPAQATTLMNREDAIVLDIRSKDEFKSGHITDARHILLSDIKAGNLSGLENSKTTPIIVVCKTGQTAQAAANDLHKAGFEQVKLLKNGLISWNEANLPLVKGKK
ncbi:rhodanese-like domain-containing protein [Aliivibrio fischeri]|nr:rhodanese-like domain-containing protein [Aliivibrio fischeri]